MVLIRLSEVGEGAISLNPLVTYYVTELMRSLRLTNFYIACTDYHLIRQNAAGLALRSLVISVFLNLKTSKP